MLYLISLYIYVNFENLIVVQFNGSLAQVDPQGQNMFSQTIDTAAQSYFNNSKKDKYDDASMRRFSCHIAVSGKSKHMALSDEPSMFAY